MIMEAKWSHELLSAAGGPGEPVVQITGGSEGPRNQEHREQKTQVPVRQSGESRPSVLCLQQVGGGHQH